MPTLKDIHCSIELSNGKAQLREFGTTYRDGGVETFVTIPESSKPFTVHLKSSSFIAPGLAMYVFIDGVYQCNRNRQNLKLRQPLGRKSLVDFVVRQKEERQEDGTMMATEWSLAMLDLGELRHRATMLLQPPKSHSVISLTNQNLQTRLPEWALPT